MAYFPKDLTELVEEYLTDGIISSKERDVLLKKAEKMGVDVDEFDLYIDAQQQKVDQSIDAAARKKRGATCPFCGGPVPQLVDKCPHCGQFITAQASEELKEILEKLEDALVDLKAGKDIYRNKAVAEKYSRKARMYYSSNPKVKVILAEIDEEISITASKANKKELFNETFKNKRFWFLATMVLGIISGIVAVLDNFEHNWSLLCAAGGVVAMWELVILIINGLPPKR